MTDRVGSGKTGEHRPVVLVVSERPGAVKEWSWWLERAGFAVATCRGPYQAVRCDRLDGGPCAVREAATVAVVEVLGPEDSELFGGWAERFCTRLPDDGSTVLVGAEDLQDEMWSWEFRLSHPVSRESLLAAVQRVASRRVAPVPQA